MFTQKEMTRLLDIANYGTQKGYHEARKIFEDILQIKPDHSGALLGLAHNHISVSEFDKAEAILKDILDQNEQDMEAKALLALSYFLADKKFEAKPLLDEVAQSSSASKELAENLLANF